MDNMVMMTRQDLLMLLMKAAAEGSDRTAYSGQLDERDFMDIAREVLSKASIPQVVDLT